MLIGEAIAVAHLPKTGGTWLRQALGLPVVGRVHDPAWLHPAPGRVLYGTARNPLAWYVSLYCYAVERQPSSRCVLLEYGRGRDDFRSFLYGATHPDEAHLTGSPGHALGVVWRPWKAAPADLALSPWGLCTWAHVHAYGHRAAYSRPWGLRWLVDHLIDTARLREATEAILGRPVSLPPRNVRNDPRPVADWYDDEMVEWVYDADSVMLDLLGYDLFSPAKKAITNVQH